MSDLLERLFERQSVAAALCELGADRVALLRVNDAWTALVGPEQDALIGSLTLDALRGSLAASRDIELEPFLSFSDGPLQLWVLPLSGRAFALEVREIDPRVRQAHVLARSHERLELAVSAGELFIWDVDLLSGEPFWDNRFSELTGYSHDELARLGRDIYHPSDRQVVFEARQQHLAGRTPTISLDARVVTKANATLWLSLHGRVVERDRDGTPLRVTGVARDITARKELEQRVAVAERMASLGTLAAGIGHEINNPLTFVTASLSLLREELVEFERAHGLPLDGLHELMSDASEGAERIRLVVDRLRAMTSGGEATGDVDLAAVLSEALKIADHQLRHRAKVVCEIAAVPPVVGAEIQLLQVFIIVLVHAAQSLPVGDSAAHTIHVRCRAEADRVLVEVTHSGHGGHAAAPARPFDALLGSAEGASLALDISRSILQRMGGELVVDGDPAERTTLRVSCPVSPSVRKPPPLARRLRLLVVDDEATIPRIVARALAAHEIVAHTDPTRALSELRDGARFDGILLDVMMPQMSGIEFHAALADIDPALQLRVVFMSGGAFTPEAQAFLENTALPQLAKPFSVADLKGLVARFAAA